MVINVPTSSSFCMVFMPVNIFFGFLLDIILTSDNGRADCS